MSSYSEKFREPLIAHVTGSLRDSCQSLSLLSNNGRLDWLRVSDQASLRAFGMTAPTPWLLNYGSKPNTSTSVCVPTYTFPFAMVGTANFTALPITSRVDACVVLYSS
jgi:hypothetical protein